MKIAAQCCSAPLFDPDRFRRHLELAYETMWMRWRRGEPPETFAVPAVAFPVHCSHGRSARPTRPAR